MDESPRCKDCDTPLIGQAVGGLCANCLLKLALEPPAEATALADEPGEEITVETSAPREAVGSRIGRYKLLQEIGAGGFGIVYLADQLEPVKRRVALKVLKPGMDTREVVARFAVPPAPAPAKKDLKSLEADLESVRKAKRHEPAETIAAMTELAAACGADGSGRKAIKLGEEALAFARRVLPAGDKRTLAAMKVLVPVYKSVDLDDDARKLETEMQSLVREK